MARQLLDVVGGLTSPIYLITLILGCIASIIAFYKIITDKAKLEADLRNEIKLNKEQIDEMTKDFDKLLTRFEMVTQQLGNYSDQARRITGLENTFEKIDRKMDTFNLSLTSMKDQFTDKLNQINVNMERKQDKPR